MLIALVGVAAFAMSPTSASADVFALEVEPIFPVTGLQSAGEVATFKSSLMTGVFTASVDWGDGTPATSATVSVPASAGGNAFIRTVSAAHTYARVGTYRLTVSVTDPTGMTETGSDTATVTNCFCVTKLPAFGKTVDIGLVRGRVLLKLPATRARSSSVQEVEHSVRLTAPREIPVGTVLDTRHGAVVVMASSGVKKGLVAGEFSGGQFRLLQIHRSSRVTELQLSDTSRSVCRAKASAARVSSRVLSVLNSKVKGSFRTVGRYSSATVRGTEWTTTDLCDGTRTTVTRGSVTVRDSVAKRTVVVTAGRSYLAKAPG